MKFTVVLLALTLLAQLSWSRFVLQPGAFLKLPDRNSRYALNSGAANKASYDAKENFLYVIGHKADLLHVVNMTNPAHPQLITTKKFDMTSMGLPDSVQVCRGGSSTREFLAISFESAGQLEKSHVHLFRLLDSSNYNGPLVDVRTMTTVEGFDPETMAWKTDCTLLLVLSEGKPHELHGTFTDPPATIDALLPSFGTSVDKVTVPIVENSLDLAGVRYVFQQCDGKRTSSSGRSSRVQDLQPKAVTVDKNNIAYIVFQDNNAIGKLDLKDQFSQIRYYDLGRKDWSHAQFDGSYEDGGINLKSRTLQSLYQPGDVVNFEIDGRVWLATADTGSIRRYSMSTCSFDESSEARVWRQQFADGLTPDEITQLKSEMSNVAEIGRLRVSKLRQSTDGWDAGFQGYDFVCTYGGRGFSIINPATMARVYESGDDFERYYTTADATTNQKATYNAKVGSYNSAQSSLADRASPETGPTPSAIVAARINNSTQVLVIANGVTGGLYTYSVASGPVVNFEGFIRRGQPGLTWNEAYAIDNDSVGEPFITDLVYFEDQGQRTVVAISSLASAISVYRLEETH